MRSGAGGLVLDRLDLDQQQALVDRDGAFVVEQPVGFRVEMQDRMAHEADNAALGADRRQNGIDDERHVGRENLDQLVLSGAFRREIEDDVALALALAEPRVGLAQHRLDHFGRSGLRSSASVELTIARTESREIGFRLP